MVYLDRVPADEDCLLSANCFSCSCVYSMVTGKGYGRKTANAARDIIQETLIQTIGYVESQD